MPIHDWTKVYPEIFQDFHLGWIVAISRILNKGLLPSDHYALIERLAGGPAPDVLILESAPAVKTPTAEDIPLATDSRKNRTLSVTDVPPKVQSTVTAPSEWFARQRNRIAIRHCDGDDLLAVIDIVPPGSKANRYNLRSFVEQTTELLAAGIHQLLIDLFPPGRRDPQGIHQVIWSEFSDDDFQLPPDKPLTLVGYSAGPELIGYIEPVAVSDRLPEMPLFLEPDLYVNVPLETTYQAAFEGMARVWRQLLE